MIDVVEILEHWHAGRSKSAVAASVGVDRETVRKYTAPAEAAGIIPGGPRLSRAEWAELATLEAFYDELGDARCAQLEAVSLDMGGAYKKATDARAAQARQCVDPFHLVALANEAVDKTRRWSWNLHRDFGVASSRWVKRTRSRLPQLVGRRRGSFRGCELG